MAIGWLTILKSVPWTDVISNAPKIAEGAKKLWGAAAKKPATSESPTVALNPDGMPESAPGLEIARLEQRLAAMEAAALDLHSQMLESSELIKALAEQNTQLIRQAELVRLRIIWLASLTAILGAIAVVSLLLVLGKFGAA